jgi:putative hydrolase of the HAD superfamily
MTVDEQDHIALAFWAADCAEEREWQEQRLLGHLPALPAPLAVGFDLGDTLIEYEGVRLDWQHEYPAALAEIASACGRTPSEKQLAAAADVLLGANTRVTPRRHELDYREVFGGVVDALGLDVESELSGCACGRSELIERSVDAFFAVFRRKLHAMPGAADLLDRLGGLGLPVWVLTDVPYGMPRRLVLEDLEAAGLSRLAPVTTTSVEVGARKPGPRGFHVLAERLDAPPARIWFVGNEQRDIAGAKAAGMTAVLLWRSEEPAPAWGQDLLVTCLEDVGSILSETRPSGGGR